VRLSYVEEGRGVAVFVCEVCCAARCVSGVGLGAWSWDHASVS
jgi:hypothetical protein